MFFRGKDLFRGYEVRFICFAFCAGPHVVDVIFFPLSRNKNSAVFAFWTSGAGGIGFIRKEQTSKTIKLFLFFTEMKIEINPNSLVLLYDKPKEKKTAILTVTAKTAPFNVVNIK